MLPVRDHIIPKSDQLNYDDFVSGDVTVKVINVTEGDRDHPIFIHLDKFDRPYKPCKSMLRILCAVWGDDGHQWKGESMTLYANHDVKFGGVKVGGIRIKAVSGIEHDMNILQTTTRSKRAPYLVKKLVIKNIDDAQLNDLNALIKATDTKVEGMVKHFGVDKLESMTGDQATKAIAMLKSKLAKQESK